MIFLLYTILSLPILAAMVLFFVGAKRAAGICNTIFSAINFILAFGLAVLFVQHGSLLPADQSFYIDALNLILILLATFLATTCAYFSQKYMWQSLQLGVIGKRRLRLYHVLYQLFMFMLLLALSTNNIGILWVAMEGATLATVLLVSLYRTPKAIEAAWKYFILCIVAIALALFGTILIYASALKLSSSSNYAMLWSVLHREANFLNVPMIKLAFVFLIVGYGTKMGLVPLHNWLPDAYTESPAPVTALLSGLLSTVSCYALLRFKMLVDLTIGNHLAGNIMMAFGLLSFLVAGLLMHRQRDIKRLFSYSSIGHMGLMTFAFGIGTPLATFAALFYLVTHALTKSAIFVVVGNVTRFSSTHKLDNIRGLIQAEPQIGWMLLFSSIAIIGLPPFGIFISELMLLISTAQNSLWLAGITLFGLIVALAGIMRHIHLAVFGHASSYVKSQINLLPAYLQLGLVLILGLYLPTNLANLLQQATILIAGKI